MHHGQSHFDGQYLNLLLDENWIVLVLIDDFFGHFDVLDWLLKIGVLSLQIERACNNQGVKQKLDKLIVFKVVKDISDQIQCNFENFVTISKGIKLAHLVQADGDAI